MFHLSPDFSQLKRRGVMCWSVGLSFIPSFEAVSNEAETLAGVFAKTAETVFAKI